MNNRKKLYEIIFEADTSAGKGFDIGLLAIIVLSSILVMAESVSSFNARYGTILKFAEWIITSVFLMEYLLRIYVIKRPWQYIFSFYGLIDLLSILPSFLGLLLVGGQHLIVLRALRLLRIFRVLKLTRYTSAGRLLYRALQSSREKIFVFLFVILNIVLIVGTAMYLIEGPEHGFSSIPTSIYWAIVTMTTVGYGDISPQTAAGQLLASIVMIAGYAIIAVPTGIVTAEILKLPASHNTQVCPYCLFDRHDDDALYCKKCGTKLNETTDPESQKQNIRF